MTFLSLFSCVAGGLFVKKEALHLLMRALELPQARTLEGQPWQKIPRNRIYKAATIPPTPFALSFDNFSLCIKLQVSSCLPASFVENNLMFANIS